MARDPEILREVLVSGYAAEGRSLARIEGKVVFIEGAVPGDLVDVRIGKNKKDWAEGKVIRFHQYSLHRVEPFCSHFGVCGGCKWQMLPYDQQLQFKQQQVQDSLERIGKLDLPALNPILGAARTSFYRNKLEFTFSNRAWLPEEEYDPQQEAFPRRDALGFHLPGGFDKVLDIHKCYLQEDPSNQIRDTIRVYALEHGLSFYDIRTGEGWLRNLVIRICRSGEVLVNLVFHHDDREQRELLLDHLIRQLPSINSVVYTINSKANDNLSDQQCITYRGPGYLLEQLGGFQFRIGPKSFFQTNSYQGEKLYEVVRTFADLHGEETVYDLYCGTGTIGIFVSPGARRVIGVELLGEAIEDARENARINQIGHAQFFSGDVNTICNDLFFQEHGAPDLVITDPPRAGMTSKLMDKLIDMESPRIVYVSCNPATQARDLVKLGDHYTVEKVQPVDMFPHTQHIENVVLLLRR
ncbi:MAG TPA: 23S rRNA (uracil(1939)-C(5))-methyltransferase RlmD [Chitinophagaceae bacterium]|nr:23S rRNA (uracil(1939)-C(5))-methyltransferase RlmD [Chitinophagaceae bacterium]